MSAFHYELSFSHGGEYRVGHEKEHTTMTVDCRLESADGRDRVEQELAGKGFTNPWIYWWKPLQTADQEKQEMS